MSIKGFFNWIKNPHFDSDEPCSNCKISLLGQSEIFMADFFNDGVSVYLYCSMLCWDEDMGRIIC